MRLKILCDGEFEKFCKIFWELNKASSSRLCRPKESLLSPFLYTTHEPCNVPYTYLPGSTKFWTTHGSTKKVCSAKDARPTYVIPKLFSKTDIVALFFVFDKYYSIMK